MLKYMDYAYAVYEEKSFTKAAEKLFISQPSLSLTIKKLEDELGFPVFERSGKEITLTPMGEKYINAIRSIKQIKEEFENDLDQILNLEKGSVSIGSTIFIASYILPEIIKSFSAKYPGISINLGVDQSTVLYEKLENGVYDIVIDNAVTKKPAYEYIPFFKEEIILGVPEALEFNNRFKPYQISANEITADCNFERKKRLPVKELDGEKFVLLKSGNKMREISESIFSEAFASPEISFEFDQLMTSVIYSMHGFGMCFLTDTVVKYEKSIENLIYYLPDSTKRQRSVYIIHKKSHYLTTANKRFIEFLNK